MDRKWPIGAVYRGKGQASFCVWAPKADHVELRILSPRRRLIRLHPGARGYHGIDLDGIGPGALYVYRLDGLIERPDPASRCQPQGPFGPSRLVDPRFAWRDRQGPGLKLHDYVLCQSHDDRVPFDDLLPRIGEIKSVGMTVLSVSLDTPLPSGSAGLPFVVPMSRGGPAGLKRLVDTCHQQGLAFMLCVSPFEPGLEGYPFVSFGPYFTDRDRFIDLDGPGSDEVRRYFIENALYWFREFQIDALNVGGVDRLLDPSPTPLLEELSCRVRQESERLSRPLYLVARSERNDPRLIRRREEGGLGVDALFNSDFCLALHAVLAGERTGRDSDYGRMEHIKKAFLEGFVCSGGYSASRQKRHGRSSRTVPGDRFIVGGPPPVNRNQKRAAAREGRKLIAASLLLSPFLPAVSLDALEGEGLAGRSPDTLRPFYEELTRVRKALRDTGLLDKQRMGILAYEKQKILLSRYWSEDDDVLVFCNFGRRPAGMPLPFPAGQWSLRFDSSDRRWEGPGSSLPRSVRGLEEGIPLNLSARSCAVYVRQRGC